LPSVINNIKGAEVNLYHCREWPVFYENMYRFNSAPLFLIEPKF